MWTHVESSWTLVLARPWRLGLSALAVLAGWRRPTRIVVPPMSDEWLRELEATSRPGDR